MSQTRNSSIELLRMLCITMIIVLHAVEHNHCCDGVSGALLSAIGNCGVTIFVLITGYYGLSFNPHKLFHLRNIASFYLLCALLLELYMGSPVSGNNIFSVIFPVISGKYWFLTSYVLLIIFSPYINRLLETLSNNRFKILVIVLILVFYIIPSFLKHYIGGDGKNIIYMASVYIMGRYIARVKFAENVKKTSLSTIFIACITVIVVLDYLKKNIGISDYLLASHLIHKLDGDNSIFILIASTSLFLLFSRLTFHNVVINQIAKSVFAIYILEWLARPFLLQYLNLTLLNIYLQPIATIGFSIGVYLLCGGIDQLRLLTTSRIADWFESVEIRLFEKAKGVVCKLLPNNQ